MSRLTHIDDQGKAVMVDVSAKNQQLRTATAVGRILLAAETRRLIEDNRMKKGDVLTTAEIAGIQGGKKTSELIPLCHPLAITKIAVRAELVSDGVRVTAEARCVGQTGIEMEALTAAGVALLTVYDMCKAVDKKMVITDIFLVEKTKEDLAGPDEKRAE
ncbi:MAG: cyclic pyranopterin monophosphate synthase MoaC [Deltaproteobacteria bacterium]|nr:cyclic pyranopterin monophosphate synthase MoaC [Deltaproteobacteria bacterium]